MRTLMWSMCLAITVLVIVAANSAFAVNIWYDFEGDSGSTVTDKLTGDGAQDGILLGNASIQTEPPGSAAWGTQSALLDTPSFSGWNQIEIPGSTGLGEDYSLAIHTDVDFEQFTNGLMRLFSSYSGVSSVGTSRMIFDMDPYGADAAAYGIRVYVNGTIGTAAPLPGQATPGYHHYALTVDSGAVTIYFDGAVAATGTAGAGYSNASANLRVGEDATAAFGNYCEQFIGNVDEIVVVNQTLTPGEIAALAGGTPATTAITPTGYAVCYDFEGAGTEFNDKFTADGAQNAIIHNDVVVDTNAKVGSGSAKFGPVDIYSEINTGVSGTDLGDAFTLSAVVNVDADGYAAGKLARLFSTYYGYSGSAYALIMDFEPSGDAGYGTLRLILPGAIVLTTTTTFSHSEDHTLTATYDDGITKLYIDGVEVASGGAAGGGVIDLGNYSIRIGEDVEAYKARTYEQIIGDVDDVLILGRALSGTEVALLHSDGAAAVIPEPGVIGLLLMGLAGLLATVRRAR